jgi:hypothetical protein
MKLKSRSEVDESGIEKTVPVQSRCDITMLATLCEMFEVNGYRVRTMSQLLNMIVETCYEGVLNSELVAESKKFDSVVDAFRYFQDRNLLQRAITKRTMSKIATAIGFENLRDEGWEPAGEAPSRYNEMHNRSNRTYHRRDRYDPRHLTILEDRERRQRAIHEALAKLPSTASASDSEAQEQNDKSENSE